MYVCMYVCVYVSLHVRMYVRMYVHGVCTFRCTFVWVYTCAFVHNALFGCHRHRCCNTRVCLYLRNCRRRCVVRCPHTSTAPLFPRCTPFAFAPSLAWAIWKGLWLNPVIPFSLFHPSLYPSIYSSVYLSICLSNLSICWSICLSNLSVRLFIRSLSVPPCSLIAHASILFFIELESSWSELCAYAQGKHCRWRTRRRRERQL